jgi:hypothetical protein
MSLAETICKNQVDPVKFVMLLQSPRKLKIKITKNWVDARNQPAQYKKQEP